MAKHSKQQPYKYIFILGTPRSGTSLLYHMLVREQKFIGGSDKESAFFSRIKKNKFSISEYIDSRYFQSLLSEEEIHQLFSDSDSHIDFFKNAIDYYLSKQGKKIFVEKTPAHTLYYSDIKKDFENALIILIKRTPAAVINSMVKTKWITLYSDNFPSFIKNNKVFKYLSACIKYHRYDREYKKISTDPDTLNLNYEDIVKENIDLKKILENRLDIELNDLFIPRPFSQEVEHRRYEFDESRIYGYKKSMPQWAQTLASFIFSPINKLDKITSVLITYLIFEPVCYLWKIRD